MDSERQGGAVDLVEKMLAEWDRDGGETYRDLSSRIVSALSELADNLQKERAQGGG